MLLEKRRLPFVKNRPPEKGAALVELAIMSTLLMMLLGGTMDFARVFYLSIAVANAARAGVQYGVQSVGNSTNTYATEQAAINDGKDVPGLTATAVRA